MQVSVHLIGGLIKANWSGKFRLHSGSVSKCHATFLTSADSLSHVHRASCRRNKNLELALVIFNFSKWKFAATNSRLNGLAVSGIGDGLRVYKILFSLCTNIFRQCGVVRIEFFEREVLCRGIPSWICSIEIGLDELEFGIEISLIRSKQHFLCSLIVCLNNFIGDSTIECRVFNLIGNPVAVCSSGYIFSTNIVRIILAVFNFVSGIVILFPIVKREEVGILF